MLYQKKIRSEFAILAAILLLAAVFRYWQINEYPKAIHYDEVINGLVVQDLLRGILPELLTYDRAREPIIFFVMAPFVWLFGSTPGALRVATETVSLSVVIGVFFLTRELFDRKTALSAALLCAVNVWASYHGRLATRSILVPLMLTLALTTGVKAWRSSNLTGLTRSASLRGASRDLSGFSKWKWWIVSGIFFGAVFYTYASNLFIIPAVFVTLAALFVYDRKAVLDRKWQLLTLAIIMFAIGTPIFIFRYTHRASGPGRPMILSVFYEGQSLEDFVKTFITQSALIGRMFFIKGDLQMRHNIPGRPAFDFLMAIPFILGIVFGLWKKEWRAKTVFALTWLGVWLMPSFVAKDAPHFLRSSGALAFVFVFPALGLTWLRDTLFTRLNKVTSVALVAALIGGSTLISARDYLFSGFLSSQVLYEEFFGNDSKPVLELNQKMNSGWVGDNLIALPKPANPPTIEASKLPQPYAQYLIPWLYDPDKLRQY